MTHLQNNFSERQALRAPISNASFKGFTVNTKSIVCAALSACAMLTSNAIAQQPAPQPPNPEQMKQIMQATMGAMVAVLGPMTDAVIEAQLSAAVKPETATRIALFKKNLYDALLKQGFESYEAMHIVVTTPLPSASPAMK